MDFPPQKLLALFDEGCGAFTRPLLSKDHNVFLQPPTLLPGEILILQQDNVTCVKTLVQAATGCLYLTNYRIIFAGNYMADTKSLRYLTKESLEKLGYRKKSKKITHQLRNLVLPSMTFKHKRKRITRKTLLYKSLDDLTVVSLPDEKLSGSSKDDNNDIVISIPILSIFDIKKFSKRYLQSEKLLMMNPGIKIISTNYLSIKLCLGEDCSYDADELIKIFSRYSKVKSPSSVFAYIYRESIVVPKCYSFIKEDIASNFYHVTKEVFRLDLLASSEWKLIDQSACESYPSAVVVPHTAINKLKIWAEFYQNNCFPLLSWRNRTNGNLFLRSGSSSSTRCCESSRNVVDEEIMNDIPSFGHSKSNSKISIFTERCAPAISHPISGISKKAEPTVNGNISTFYRQCQNIYLDDVPLLSSTHSSALKLMSVIQKNDDSHYLSSLEESGWLKEISILLECTVKITSELEKANTSVLLSLGSGSERAAQLSSLVELLIDPYYRTFDGFQVLIQKEWLSVKYSFCKRSLLDFSNKEDLSPLFLQFLDCVYQLSLQFPAAFQFSNSFLEFLALHSYSGRFDTFIDSKVSKKGTSIWSYINVYSQVHDNLYNFNYDKLNNQRVLHPSSSIVHLEIWPWFNSFKREESLLISQMFSAIQLEKLQQEFKDLLSLHAKLLNRISKMDEHSTDLSYNSQSVTSSEMSSAYSESSSGGNDTLQPLNNKHRRWRSADDLLSTTSPEEIFRKPLNSKNGLEYVENLNENSSIINSSITDQKERSSTFYCSVNEFTLLETDTIKNSSSSSSPLQCKHTSAKKDNTYICSSDDNDTIKLKNKDSIHSRVNNGDSLQDRVDNGHPPHDEFSMGHSPYNEVSTGHSSHNEFGTGLSSHEDVSTGHSPHDEASVGHSSHDEVGMGHSPHDEVSTGHPPHYEYVTRQSSHSEVTSFDDDSSVVTNQNNSNLSVQNSDSFDAENFQLLRNGNDNQPTSAIELLKGLHDSPRFDSGSQRGRIINLKDYLSSKGVNFNEANEIEITKSSCRGFLTKQGNRYKSWKKRWFVIDLCKKLVTYYEDSTTVEPKGLISYRNIRSVFPDDNQKKNPFLFYVVTYERTYSIKASNKSLMNIWVCCFSVPLGFAAT